ncbi:MAG TPA: hypothetical protein VE862_00385 [Candidatus Acidoferrum sp.]|nr:hypothetical protein [Candidatus Acidoferrum sp.]
MLSITRIFRYAFLAIILLMCALSFTSAPPAYAQTSPASNGNLVQVGIYVLNIGEFDLNSGTYTMDFYLSMQCVRPNCKLGSFEFMNGRAQSIRLEENSSTSKFWRIQANLYDNLNLQNYPFDSHTLSIRIEDTTLTTQNLTYQVDPDGSGLDPSIVVVGWAISGWNQTVINHYYQVYNQTYSQYVFSVNLEREPAFGFEVFIPVFFLAFISLIGMLMYGKTSSVLENRILLTASCLIAAVLFQFSLDNNVPPLGYLTFADKFMIATYFIIISSLVIGVLELDCHHRKNDIRSAQIQYYAIRSMPVLAVAIYLLLFRLFL